ncbi:MAG: DUF4402 domain-containing protein [Alphaproteobacteria bacterium]|nr:DUF4402 domain-containing protein [Alphaproteobacteria bacterium]
MKKLFLGVLFTFGSLSSIHAATTTGEAHVNMITPLSIEETQSIDFGDVAIDGPGTLSMDSSGNISCPSAYICGGTVISASFTISGKENTEVSITTNGSTARLAYNGLGLDSLLFTPVLSTDGTGGSLTLDESGSGIITAGGSITFTGSEKAGTYISNHVNGWGYQIDIIY